MPDLRVRNRSTLPKRCYLKAGPCGTGHTRRGSANPRAPRTLAILMATHAQLAGCTPVHTILVHTFRTTTSLRADRTPATRGQRHRGKAQPKHRTSLLPYVLHDKPRLFVDLRSRTHVAGVEQEPCLFIRAVCYFVTLCNCIKHRAHSNPRPFTLDIRAAAG